MGQYLAAEAYGRFTPQMPKVPWSSLSKGKLKIPRNNFVLWFSILEKLTTMDLPWLQQHDGSCLLCNQQAEEAAKEDEDRVAASIATRFNFLEFLYLVEWVIDHAQGNGKEVQDQHGQSARHAVDAVPRIYIGNVKFRPLFRDFLTNLRKGFPNPREILEVNISVDPLEDVATNVADKGDKEDDLVGKVGLRPLVHLDKGP
ncbi:hypothetical protein Salat_1667500 [Sesamum alatum]|uniref:Uncharacterized protein n=1 Tax=Sesamum alatum TaxID=300844 RepID=A0AAE1Y7D9_9LAMI|nr:hypothetical protein Salat_1667500 [Sesamum alatum]